MVHTLAKRSPSKAASADDLYWAAVVARDKSYDGRFYYSVATTGVYCRPSCAARLPKRANVAFHKTPAAAETAGFRPCKRCQPAGPSLDARYATKVAEACRLIETAEQEPSLAQLARTAGLSPFHFHRLFKAIAGVTPKAYAQAHRHRRVRESLKKRATVTEALHEAGFNSSGRFYANAADVLGMSPTDFRTGGANAAIHFAVGKCSLGSVLVAASEKGICAILLGDTPEALARNLKDLFPHADLIGGDRKFERLVSEVIAFVEAPSGNFPLPLDVRGTAFQHRVWQALRDIPPGSTASYADIARRIGKPDAVRAVAGACAANKIAVAIPCHRVVRTDGGLSGYRWGTARKRRLIEREAKS